MSIAPKHVVRRRLDLQGQVQTRHDLVPQGDRTFEIRHSEADTRRGPEVTPDAALCPDCLRELFDPHDRRYRYAFITCTNCGPRYSIVRTVPYDRPATTMASFPMCERCLHEYTDPADRRFHAQPNACPDCGPSLLLCRNAKTPKGQNAPPNILHPSFNLQSLTFNLQPSTFDLPHQRLEGDPVEQAARILYNGILAVKGIGGYHLACRADREDVVSRLRRRRLRDGKLLAVMVPDIPAAHRVAKLTPHDVETLQSAAAPILLAPKRSGHGFAPSVAPGSSDFGLMLPYTPVHHLLFAEGLGPLVMTSAKLSGEPLTYEDDDAFAHLGDVADAFLIHNREIFRPIDDSVVFSFRGEVSPLRRARGYAPQVVRVGGSDEGAKGRSDEASERRGDEGVVRAGLSPGREEQRSSLLSLELRRRTRVLAVGGELKSAVCLLDGVEAVVSEHLGNVKGGETYGNFVRAIEGLKKLYRFEPEVVAHDLHPQYASTGYARRLGMPTVAVQHHHAHVASVMAEWQEGGPVIGMACDGAGYGTDGAVWGCELLHCDARDFVRLGQLKYFPLVGGDVAAVHTWRAAAALLRQALGPGWRTGAGDVFHRVSPEELDLFERQVAAGYSKDHLCYPPPACSSLGRVFDAVAFLLGLCERNRHEAEAAMAVQAAACDGPVEPYSYGLADQGGRLELSVLPLLVDMLEAKRAGESTGAAAARFHETIARMLSEAAGVLCDTTGAETVALSGGCFANRRLLGRIVDLMEQSRRRVIYHRKVPCGDGGLALGQAVVAAEC